MSEEAKELLKKFFYHLAVEQGFEKYGEGVEVEELYKKTANETTEHFISNNDLEEMVTKKIDKIAFKLNLWF